MDEQKLVCTSGEVVAKIGDRFNEKDGEWEIVRFGPGGTIFSVIAWRHAYGRHSPYRA